MSEVPATFQPGDITVSPVIGGFLIGRIVQPQRPGDPAWTLITSVTDKDEALRQAQRFADGLGTTVYLQIEPGRFVPVQPPD